MRLRVLLFLLAAGACSAPAQIITTHTGTDFVFPATPLQAVSAPLGNVAGIAVDAQHNVYAADSGNNIVVRISPDGTLTSVAGNGIAGFSGDGGPAINASLDQPAGVALAPNGELYIIDGNNYRIRKVSGGKITTVAGTGLGGYSGDGGPATKAKLDGPAGIALDSAGNLYIADTYNNRIRRVSGGTITTIAGNGQNGFSGDGGPATGASLSNPAGVAVDSAGNLYIADWFNYRVREVTGGIITTVAGNGSLVGGGDGGPASKASLPSPYGIAVDLSGNFYIADYLGCVIRKVSGGIITTVAGNGRASFFGDGGRATSASLDDPQGVAVDSFGDIYIADTVNSRIRKVSGGTISTFAGNGAYRYSGDGSAAASAALVQPMGIAVDGSGNLYIADGAGNRIRQVSGGTITTVAGNGVADFTGDGGPAASAALNNPRGVAVDSAGNLYIADWLNSRIRKVSGGTITTVAGSSSPGFSGDGGPATSARLNGPMAIAINSAGDLYIADYGNQRVRKVSGGIITTVAGNGNASFSGDGGLGTSAALNHPTGLAVDPAGNLYIADSMNYRVRKVALSNGMITTVAGNGNGGSSGDRGPATSASLRLRGIAVDSSGNLYIGDAFNDRVRKVSVSDGTITTIAGNGSESFSGDGGPPTSASLDQPWGVALDSSGNIYIADTLNYRIREVLAAKPAVLVSTTSLSLSGQSTGAPAPAQSFSIASIPGLAFSIAVTAVDGKWLSVTPQSGSAPRVINVVADPSTLTSPGTYHGTITIATPLGDPPLSTVNVTFQVSPAQLPVLAPLDPPNLSFTYAKSSPAQSQRLTISNSGGGVLAFTVATDAVSPASTKWLNTSFASGQATPASPAVLAVTADPTGLTPGAYTGTVTVSSGGSTLAVPVTMTISTLDRVIQLSQRGLTFTAVAQGGVVPPQTFGVRNIGSGVISWTASTVTLSGGNGWLQVTPADGSSDALLDPPVVTVSVNPAGLAEGNYYGILKVASPAAANSPQVVTVFLRITPAGSDAVPMIEPGSLLFTAVTGGESPGSQNVNVYNIVAAAKTFRSVVGADAGLTVITLPTDATLDPKSPTPIVVQPLTTGLASGVYSSTVTLQFSDGRLLPVNVKVIVSNTDSASGTSGAAQRKYSGAPMDATACTPTKLVPALISLANSFELPTGLPVKLGVYVKDDCGNPIQAGSVTAKFSNGDSPATLLPLSSETGLWEGQWLTRNGVLNTATVSLHAVSGTLTGDQQVSGSLLALQKPPTFDQNSVLATFGGAQYAALAPGSVITIYGDQLASDSAVTTGIPLPQSWLGTQVYISGGNDVLLPLPLYYVGPGQVNAIVPYKVQTNVPLQILVERGTAVSQPVAVNVAAASPALFGGGVMDYPANGNAWYWATANAPAHAGDTLVVYCLGLGAVSPPVIDGGVPSGFSQASGVSVQIGSQTAQPAFAGLSQYPGLYQINVVVPAGTGTGSAVPLTVTIGGQTSQPIAIPIQ